MAIKEIHFNKNNLLSNKNRLFLFRNSKFFHNLTTLIIILYSLLLGVKTHHINIHYINILNVMDKIVTIYFLFEIFIKIYSEKNKVNFFKNGWNAFDFIVIMISIIPDILFDSILIARLIRVFRILRIITINENLKKLISTLEGAVPSILNIVLLMFIIFYIYAILGNQLFGNLESNLWSDSSMSLLTLFRIFTFEDWTDVMYEAMDEYPFSWIYFISFIIINSFIVFNLFIAIIITEFSRIKDNDIKNELENNDQSVSHIINKLNKIQIQLDRLETIKNDSK